MIFNVRLSPHLLRKKSAGCSLYFSLYNVKLNLLFLSKFGFDDEILMMTVPVPGHL